MRFAEPGETVVTLDDVERELDPGDVLIVDDVATAAIGGVMGAGTTEVATDHRRAAGGGGLGSGRGVRTQRRLHLVSEAGRRYERTVDPAISVAALDRCAALLAEIAGGTVEPTLTDWRGDPPRDGLVTPAGEHGRRPAGSHRRRRLPRRHHAAPADPDRRDGAVDVRPVDRRRPPSWRPDLQQPADLVEEVLRLEGLELIPSVLPPAPAGRGLTPVQRRRRAIGKSLALNGYVEVLPTPFLPAGVFDQWGLPPTIRGATPPVLNPLESDRPQLATTLLPGLLEAWAATSPVAPSTSRCSRSPRSSQPTAETRAIEPIPVDRRPTDEEIATLDESLPRQPQHVGVVLTGLREPRGPVGTRPAVEAADAFEAVRIIGRAAGSRSPCVPAQHLPWHPGRCAEVLVGRRRSSVMPGSCIRRSSSGGAAEGHLRGGTGPRRGTDRRVAAGAAVSPFPAVFQDVSLIVAEDVAAQAVDRRGARRCRGTARGVRLFDVYVGPQIGEGRKSLALALRFRAADRTLTEDEASAARDAAVAVAAERVGAVQRR